MLSFLLGFIPPIVIIVATWWFTDNPKYAAKPEPDPLYLEAMKELDAMDAEWAKLLNPEPKKAEEFSPYDIGQDAPRYLPKPRVDIEPEVFRVLMEDSLKNVQQGEEAEYDYDYAESMAEMAEQWNPSATIVTPSNHKRTA